MDERKYWVWISQCLGQGSSKSRLLLHRYSTAKRIYEADRGEISEATGYDKARLAKMFSKITLAQAEQTVNWCDYHGVRILVPTDADYPRSLLALVNLPLVLYSVGNIPDWNSRFMCAVVGTRSMTDYGKRTAFDFGYELSAGGAVVVSGMAIGIDGMAMAGAIEAGGQTVAVLGCGIDICYPKAHKQLMREVLKKGAVITEYPPSTPPAGANFPVRNRIISGLSHAAVVVEGDDSSGALITANHALYQGKQVFAVPGKVDEENSSGTNYLIKKGVPAVTEASDVLLEFKRQFGRDINANRLRRRYQGHPADEYLEVAKKFGVISSAEKNELDGSYYGRGLYGGRDDGHLDEPKKKPKKETVKKEKSPPPKKEEPKEEKNLLEGVEEEYLKVYYAMKPDVPTLPDELVNSGFDISEVLVSMTMLEISGAVEASPGGYFIRRGSESIESPAKDE